ncbi:MAG: hypothetical protein ACREX3_01615 [Gammaproteobacteria bacterium]
MARRKVNVVANQVFVGLPWRNVRPRYEKCIDKLEQKYPLHFTIVGRKDAQDAEDLLQVITNRIDTSSYAIFDATGGNANVSLEYGYAEAVDLPRALYLSTHKSATGGKGGSIISDLGGKRRVEYKNEQSLRSRLDAFCKDHDYTKRFESFLQKRVRATKRGEKKRQRTLALKLIHYLDGKAKARRADMMQSLQASNYSEKKISGMLTKLHKEGLLKVSRGRFSDVRIS